MKTKVICVSSLFLTIFFLSTPSITPAASLYLSIPDGSPGSTVTATVGFKDATDVKSFELILDFSFGNILSASLSQFTRKTDFFPARSLSGGETNIVVKGITGKRIYISGLQPNSKTGMAEIGTIIFNVADSANIGDTQDVKLSGKIRNESGYADIVPVLETFKVTTECALGDINCDSSDPPNVLDLQVLINCILKKVNCDRCDIDGSGGDPNVLDLQRLINMILNRSRAVSHISKVRSKRDSDTLQLPYMQLQKNETGVLGLNLVNENVVAAMQISFTYDSTIGFTITDTKLTARTANFDAPIFQINDSDPKNVEVSVILYSMSGATISPESGNILEFSYETTNDCSGTTAFTFKEALFSDEYANPIQITPVNGKISSEMGDVDHSGTVDLKDAIAVLKILIGIKDIDIYADTDVNGDGKIGSEDVIFILHVISDIR